MVDLEALLVGFLVLQTQASLRHAAAAVFVSLVVISLSQDSDEEIQHCL